MTHQEIKELAGHRAVSPWVMKLVGDAVAKEREKSFRLWMLLDDVDTADDIAKSDDAIYRNLCRQAHKKRWDVLTGNDIDDAIRARGQA